ncbi:sugar ABC transporter permease [Aestuariimicrobium sp. Y1814]|uniref:sugar ABC transporter permease n=1 Tax=Aestuariimicrobium sp. Y1814 TaxID=3418742 RepID=UPI003DA6FACA
MSTPQIRPDRSTQKLGFGKWLARVGWRHLVAIVAVVFAAFPLVYVLSASLNPHGTLTGSNTLFTTFSLENYQRLLSDPIRPYGRWYANTLFIAGTTAVVTVLLGAMAAYAFSRLRFKGRRPGLMSLLLIQMFPQLLMVVAIFLLLSALGDVIPALGIGSSIALILVYLGGALGTNTYLMYGFFNTVPMALDEAAKVDGAGHARIFFTIILRLVAPILAVVGLLSFVATFNEYVVASVVLGNDPNHNTLAIGLYQYVSSEFNTYWQVFAAGAVLAALPVLVLFLWLQKYIVSGLTVGAVK